MCNTIFASMLTNDSQCWCYINDKTVSCHSSVISHMYCQTAFLHCFRYWLFFCFSYVVFSEWHLSEIVGCVCLCEFYLSVIISLLICHYQVDCLYLWVAHVYSFELYLPVFVNCICLFLFFVLLCQCEVVWSSDRSVISVSIVNFVCQLVCQFCVSLTHFGCH